jgi:hypothetical protein
LDLVSYLTRSEASVTAARGELAESGADESARVELRTASGVPARVVVDQRPSRLERRRALRLSTATHVWHGDLLSPSLVRVCRATGAREAIPLDTEEPLLAQALAFAAASRGAGSSEIATGVDGMRALLAAESAGRKLRRL